MFGSRQCCRPGTSASTALHKSWMAEPTGPGDEASVWEMAHPALGSAPRLNRHRNMCHGGPVANRHSPGVDGHAASCGSTTIRDAASPWPAAAQPIEQAPAAPADYLASPRPVTAGPTASSSLRPGPGTKHGIALQFHGWGQPVELICCGLQKLQQSHQACPPPALLTEAATMLEKAVSPTPQSVKPPPPPPPPPAPPPQLETAPSSVKASAPAPSAAKFDAEASEEQLWVELDGGPFIPGHGTASAADSWLMWGLDPTTVSPRDGGWPHDSLGHCLGRVKPAIHLDWVHPAPARSNRSWDIHFPQWTSLRSFLLYLHNSPVVWPGETDHVVAVVRPFAFLHNWYQGPSVKSMSSEKVWSKWCEMAGHGHGAPVIWCGPENCIWTSGGTGPKEEASRLFPGLSIQYRWPPFPQAQAGSVVDSGWRCINWEAVLHAPAYTDWRVHMNVVTQYLHRHGKAKGAEPFPSPPAPFDIRHFVVFSQPVA